MGTVEGNDLIIPAESGSWGELSDGVAVVPIAGWLASLCANQPRLENH